MTIFYHNGNIEMANKDVLYNLWLEKKMPNKVTIEEIMLFAEDNEYKLNSRTYGKVSSSGLNYAVLRFILNYSYLDISNPKLVSKLRLTTNYGIWKYHLEEIVFIKTEHFNEEIVRRTIKSTKLMNLLKLESDIRIYIRKCSMDFQNEFVEHENYQKKLWAIKYIPPVHLESFLKNGNKLFISKSPGSTWGDGVYLTSTKNPYSSMMYGSIGIMGWIDANDINVYNACRQKGINLYQQWIAYKKGLYNYLTTTVHSNWANRILRNQFKKKFNIDIVFFHPDEYNTRYCNRKSDIWFLLSDWSTERPAYSHKVKNCKPLIIVGEVFEKIGAGLEYNDLIGRNFATFNLNFYSPPFSRGMPNSLPITELKKRYSQPDELIFVRP